MENSGKNTKYQFHLIKDKERAGEQAMTNGV